MNCCTSFVLHLSGPESICGPNNLTDALFYFHFHLALHEIHLANILELGIYRGGCVICMDYGRFANDSYVRLVRLFDQIAQILTVQLHLLDYMGFDMSNGYLFGFSYGGQLATEAGRRIGYKRLKEIDSNILLSIFRCYL